MVVQSAVRRRLVGREGGAEDVGVVLGGEFFSFFGGLIGELADGAEVFFHGSGGLVHDDEAGGAFAGFDEGVGHVAGHE